MKKILNQSINNIQTPEKNHWTPSAFHTCYAISLLYMKKKLLHIIREKKQRPMNTRNMKRYKTARHVPVQCTLQQTTMNGIDFKEPKGIRTEMLLPNKIMGFMLFYVFVVISCCEIFQSFSLSFLHLHLRTLKFRFAKQLRTF